MKYSFFLTKIFQYLTHLTCKLYVALKYKLRIEGQENIPARDSNYIMASNHSSYDDILILAAIFKNNIAFISKRELFRVPFLGAWMDWTGNIHVDRDKPKTSTIKQVKKCLSTEGWKLGIFIEGTRSKLKGSLSKPQNGLVFMSKLTKAPIVPVGIAYGENKNLLVSIGKSYNLEPGRDISDLSWDCLNRIAKLSGALMPERIETDV